MKSGKFTLTQCIRPFQNLMTHNKPFTAKKKNPVSATIFDEKPTLRSATVIIFTKHAKNTPLLNAFS